MIDNTIIRNNLKIIHKYNFDGPHCEDSERDTNIAIINLYSIILKQYNHLFKSGYSIIIKYNQDIYTYLTFKLMRNFVPLTTVKPDFYICGSCDSIDIKKYLGNVNIITPRKAKKIKKAVLITGYHPICNVENDNELSKYFKTILNPLEHFTPSQLIQLQEFYLIDSDPFYDGDLGHQDEFLLDFFTYPVGNLTETNIINIPFDEKKKVTEFILSGTEKDFKLYDVVVHLNAEDEDNIFIYNVKDEKAMEFITFCLNPYISRRNAPNQFNVVFGENNIFHPQQIYNYIDYQGER